MSMMRATGMSSTSHVICRILFVMKTMKKSLFGILAVMAVLSAMLSCGQGPQNAKNQLEADSLLAGANNAVDNERRLALCDSLEQTGDMSVIMAATYRGYAYQRLGKFKL